MGKKTRSKIEVSICAWFDLLGYGSMLKESNFDPTVEQSVKAIERLENFHQYAAQHADRRFNIFALNDALISNMDLSPKSPETTMDFVKRAIKLHDDINKKDKNDGFFGMRTIIASGFRVRKVNSVTIQSGVKDYVIDKLESGEIDPKQAVHQAISSRPYFGIIPELQANFAFTKAYLADAAGGKEGFEGANCYLDLSIFERPLPDFLKFSAYINWEKNGLWAKFGKLKNIDLEKVEELRGKGFLNSAQIGENITTSPEVSLRIKQITNKSMKNRK